MNEIISYAQNREDVYLNWLLAGKNKGFYVDIGASDPIHDSVTKLFYDRGWQGINIEPIEKHIKNLRKERPRDINLQIGIAQKTGKLQFRQYIEGDGLSTFAEETKNEHLNSLKHLDYEVNVRRLEDVLDENKVKVVDFMKIDVEGYEYEVISSNNWTKYRPLILVIEANHANKDWRPILIKNGYQKIFYDGLNEYYSCDTKIQKNSIKTYPDFMIGSLILNERAIQHIKWREGVVAKQITAEAKQKLHSIQIQLDKEKNEHTHTQELANRYKAQLDKEKNEHTHTQELANRYKAQLDLPFKIRYQNLIKEFLAISKIEVKAWVYPQASKDYIDTEEAKQLIASIKDGEKLDNDHLLALSSQLDENNPLYIYPKKSRVFIYQLAKVIFKTLRKVLRAGTRIKKKK